MRFELYRSLKSVTRPREYSSLREKVLRSKANYEWRWRLRADNQKIIANGGEGYKRKRGALNAIELIRAVASSTPVVEVSE